MKYIALLSIALFFSCTSEKESESGERDKNRPLTAMEKYHQLHANDSIESISKGSVGNGSIENATLIPFQGSNYEYFDKTSYLGGRAFTNSKVAAITVATYEALELNGVDRHFRVMEFSRKEGGKMFPHRTHQNGLSVDYMMPVQKDGKPYYELDKKGASHYLLEFDKDGKFTEDASISIDFDMAAQHILELDKQARKKGMRIHKVIFNTHLKDELYATTHGKKLRSSGIYVTRNLSKLINDLHDDHYHVDFINL
jgi:penicillin-insensitive murein endopeptidase